jgi:hypothetical protein
MGPFNDCVTTEADVNATNVHYRHILKNHRIRAVADHSRKSHYMLRHRTKQSDMFPFIRSEPENKTEPNTRRNSVFLIFNVISFQSFHLCLSFYFLHKIHLNLEVEVEKRDSADFPRLQFPKQAAVATTGSNTKKVAVTREVCRWEVRLTG